MTILSAQELLRRLPHGHPFLLLDEVDVQEAGVRGVGLKNVTISDPVFSGHFPGNPLYPGVLLIEAAAQTAGIVATADEAASTFGIPGRGAYLANVRRFAFKQLVRPGDQLRIETVKSGVLAQLVTFSVTIRVSNSVVATGSIALSFFD